MCLTTEALLIFLNLLPRDIVEMGQDQITVRAETRDAVWTAEGDKWCTAAPQLDKSIRFKLGDPV